MDEGGGETWRRKGRVVFDQRMEHHIPGTLGFSIQLLSENLKLQIEQIVRCTANTNFTYVPYKKTQIPFVYFIFGKI